MTVSVQATIVALLDVLETNVHTLETMLTMLLSSTATVLVAMEIRVLTDMVDTIIMEEITDRMEVTDMLVIIVIIERWKSRIAQVHSEVMHSRTTSIIL